MRQIEYVCETAYVRDSRTQTNTDKRGRSVLGSDRTQTNRTNADMNDLSAFVLLARVPIRATVGSLLARAGHCRAWVAQHALPPVGFLRRGEVPPALLRAARCWIARQRYRSA